MFPQTIIIKLASPIVIRSLHFKTTNVRKIQVEGCDDPHSHRYTVLGETEIGSNNGELQIENVNLEDNRGLYYVKFTILSGYTDFVSIHTINFS